MRRGGFARFAAGLGTGESSGRGCGFRGRFGADRLRLLRRGADCRSAFFARTPGGGGPGSGAGRALRKTGGRAGRPGGAHDPGGPKDGEDADLHVQPADELHLPGDEGAAGRGRDGRHQADELDHHGLVPDAAILRQRELAGDLERGRRRGAAEPMPAPAGPADLALRDAERSDRGMPGGKMAPD